MPQPSSQFQFQVAFGHSCQVIDTVSTQLRQRRIYVNKCFPLATLIVGLPLVPYEPLTSQYSLYCKQIGKNAENGWLSWQYGAMDPTYSTIMPKILQSLEDSGQDVIYLFFKIAFWVDNPWILRLSGRLIVFVWYCFPALIIGKIWYNLVYWNTYGSALQMLYFLFCFSTYSSLQILPHLFSSFLGWARSTRRTRPWGTFWTTRRTSKMLSILLHPQSLSWAEGECKSMSGKEENILRGLCSVLIWVIFFFCNEQLV